MCSGVGSGRLGIGSVLRTLAKKHVSLRLKSVTRRIENPCTNSMAATMTSASGGTTVVVRKAACKHENGNDDEKNNERTVHRLLQSQER